VVDDLDIRQMVQRVPKQLSSSREAEHACCLRRITHCGNPKVGAASCGRLGNVYMAIVRWIEGPCVEANH
jgi:hypothetical protein